MPSPVQTAATLKVPKANERPRFEPSVSTPIQAHIWIRWLSKLADNQQAKGKDVVYVSVAGARDIAKLIERLATERGDRRDD